MNIRRGIVYLAAMDPTIGRKISKTPPVVVISNDKNNTFSGTVTILPIISQAVEKVYPFEVAMLKGSGNLPKNQKLRLIKFERLINAD
jgi:mRNA interferase MazF